MLIRVINSKLNILVNTNKIYSNFFKKNEKLKINIIYSSININYRHQWIKNIDKNKNMTHNRNTKNCVNKNKDYKIKKNNFPIIWGP